MLKKIFLFSATAFFLLCQGQINAEEGCLANWDVGLEFSAIKEDEPTELSHRQIPDLREDDLLRLEKLTVTNTGRCATPDSKFTMTLQTPNREIDHLFCQNQLNIPSLQPNEKYELEYSRLVYKTIENSKIPRQEYLDNRNKTFILCSVSLSDVGAWTISGDMTYEKNVNLNGKGSLGWFLFYNQNKIRKPNFKVHSKTALEEIELSQKFIDATRSNTIISILSGLFGVIIGGAITYFAQKHMKIHDSKIRRSKEIFTPLYHDIQTILNYFKASSTGYLSLDAWEEKRNNYLFLASNKNVRGKISGFYEKVEKYNELAERFLAVIKSTCGKKKFDLLEGIIIPLRKEYTYPSLEDGIDEQFCWNVFNTVLQIDPDKDNLHSYVLISHIRHQLTGDKAFQTTLKIPEEEIQDVTTSYGEKFSKSVLSSLLNEDLFGQIKNKREELVKEARNLKKYLQKRIEEYTLD